MAKEFFKDLPDKSTPLSAARINGLLDGEESIGSIVVEDIKSKNLFDKNSVIENYYLSYTDGTPTWDSNMAYSDFIEVEPNIDYTISIDTASILCIHFYDSNKNWLNYELVNDNVSTSLSKKAPATAKYVRLCFGKTKKDKVQFEKGIVATSYTNHINFDILKGEEWKELSLSNEFENYGENYAPLRLKKIGNIVYVQGMIKSKTTGYVTIATLPETYRPKYALYSICISGDNAKGLVFQPNGELKIGDAVNNSWIGIDTYFPID